jgi:uncharacterized protein (TIGR04255 family)
MQESSQINPFPHYDKPPVIETVLGLQFEPVAQFQNAHLGVFWNSLNKDEWPTVTDAPSLDPQFERFSETRKWSRGMQLRLTKDLTTRLQIRNADRNRMIQIQNGRFHFNWIGQGNNYPRYTTVYEEFSGIFRQFMDFLAQNGLGPIKPNQWEVTYVNHIPKGTIWNDPHDWSFFRPISSNRSVEEPLVWESFAGEWHFIIPEQRGRLHVHWQHAKADIEEESPEIIRLTLTARGAIQPDAEIDQAVKAGLDLGHETIVCSFEKLMTNDANDYWGRK